MIIKYCDKCEGRPYSEDLAISTCPICGRNLLIESVDIDSLAHRSKLQASPTGCAGPGRQPILVPPPGKVSSNPSSGGTPSRLFPGTSGNAGNLPVTPTQNNFPTPAPANVPINNGGHAAPGNNAGLRKGTVTVEGKVSQCSVAGRDDDTYPRSLFNRVIDAIVYHQRLENVIHRFYVRVDNGRDAMGNSHYSDIPVNVHGTIVSGMEINNNSEVEVKGKYKDRVLMASKISVVNNGEYSRIRFQRSRSVILYSVLATVAAIALIVFVANMDGNFFANLKRFLLTWLVVSAVTVVLYFFLIFSKIGLWTRIATGKPKKFPLMWILFFSQIIAMFFMNSFGIGTSLSDLFSKLLAAMMPTVIIIVVIFILLKLIFKLMFKP